MSIIADAINAIKKLADSASENSIAELQVNGRRFIGTMEVPRKACEPHPPTISGASLALLVTVLEKGLDVEVPKEGEVIVHVKTATQVELITQANLDGKRYVIATAGAREPTFGRHLSQEDMMVFLQTCFETSPELAQVIETVGNVVGEQVVVDSDDGVTQLVETRQGLKSTALKPVKNPVKLKPYATFREVPQVEEEFVFRIISTGKSPMFTLIRTESGLAELERKRLVAEHLRKILPDNCKDTVVY